MSTDDTRPLPVKSLVLETNHGGVHVTICACGALLVRSQIAWGHIDVCPTAAAAIAAGGTFEQ